MPQQTDLSLLYKLWSELQDSEDNTGCTDDLTVIENPTDSSDTTLIDRIDTVLRRLCGLSVN